MERCRYPFPVCPFAIKPAFIKTAFIFLRKRILASMEQRRFALSRSTTRFSSDRSNLCWWSNSQNRWAREVQSDSGKLISLSSSFFFQRSWNAHIDWQRLSWRVDDGLVLLWSPSRKAATQRSWDWDCGSTSLVGGVTRRRNTLVRHTSPEFCRFRCNLRRTSWAFQGC